jgi:hypothetical protein
MDLPNTSKEEEFDPLGVLDEKNLFMVPPQENQSRETS